jgi:hypothetical protein
VIVCSPKNHGCNPLLAVVRKRECWRQGFVRLAACASVPQADRIDQAIVHHGQHLRPRVVQSPAAVCPYAVKQALASLECRHRPGLIAQSRDPAGVHVLIHSDVCPTSASGTRAGYRGARFMSLHTDKVVDKMKAYAPTEVHAKQAREVLG